MEWIRYIIGLFRGPTAENFKAVNRGWRELAEQYKKKMEELEKERDEWKTKYEELKNKKRGMYE